jgi:hypothetical protein
MKFVLVVLMLAAPAFSQGNCFDARWARQEARSARRWAAQEARAAERDALRYRAEARRYAMEARREAQMYRNQLRRELRDGLRWNRPDTTGMRRIF